MRKRNIIRIVHAKNSGFCYGVKRAISLAEQTAKSGGTNVYTLGPIIHNPQVVAKLQKEGVKVVRDLDSLYKGECLVIRSHGIPLGFWEEMEKKKLKVIDATCPFVKRAQNMVDKLYKDGYFVIIVGEKDHPEVVGLISYAKGNGVIIDSPAAVKKMKLPEKVGVVSQTTQSVEQYEKITGEILKKNKNAKIFSTICLATSGRQKEAVAIARKVEAMIIVGGRNSANTARLAQMCAKINKKTRHIETVDDLDEKMLRRSVRSVGIIGGASTPEWIIQGVIDKIKQI